MSGHGRTGAGRRVDLRMSTAGANSAYRGGKRSMGAGSGRTWSSLVRFNPKALSALEPSTIKSPRMRLTCCHCHHHDEEERKPTSGNGNSGERRSQSHSSTVAKRDGATHCRVPFTDRLPRLGPAYIDNQGGGIIPWYDVSIIIQYDIGIRQV